MRTRSSFARWLVAAAALAVLTPRAIAAQDRYARALEFCEWREYAPGLSLLDSIGTDSLAQALKCRVLLQQKQYQRLLMEATQVGILWPGTAGARAAAWQLAYAQEQLGQYREAIDAYRNAVVGDSAVAPYAAFRIARCQSKLATNGAQRKRTHKKHLDDGDDRFRPALALNPRFSIRTDTAMQTAPPSAPAGKRPYALKLAARYVKRRKYDKARAVLAEYVRCYPKGNWRGEASYQIAKCWERQGKTDQALAAYRRAADATVGANWSDDALFRAGWCQFKLDDTTAALDSWRMVEAAFPASDCRGAAWYWSAKLLAARGDTAAAARCREKLARQFPYSFYSLKTQRTFDDMTAAAQDDTVAMRPREHSAPDSCGILDDPVYRMGVMLAGYGLSADAFSALSRLEDRYWRDAASLCQLARAYAQCGQDERAIDTALRALRLHDGVRPAGLLDIIYPRRYLATVRRLSDSARLDPAMVLAVIHKESKFDERCLSWAGARGLMQVMPRTGRLLAGDRKFPKEKLFDPLVSIRFGTTFLAGMLREFRGSRLQALAAYNAGPARVHAWLKDRNSQQDEDYFLEQIYLPETKRYIQVVMENYYMYCLLLHEQRDS